MLALIALVLWGLTIVAVAVVLTLRAANSPMKRTVVVHTKDDRTIRGVLHGKYADRWTLIDATIVTEHGREQALGGTQHVPIQNIAFVQEIQPKVGED